MWTPSLQLARTRPALRRVLRPLARRMGQKLQSRGARAMRGLLLGPPEVRWLLPSDVPATLAFVRRHLWIDERFIEFHLRRGTGAFGAFDRFGRLRGVGFLDQYTRVGMTVEGWWIRAVAVSRRARGLGYGHALVRALMEEAQRRHLPVVHAAIEPGNTSSLRLFEACGFTQAPEWKRQGILARWRESLDEREWWILEGRPQTLGA